jgi:hypothetical protein
LNGLGSSVLTISASIAVALLLAGTTWNKAQAALSEETIQLDLFVGGSQSAIDCDTAEFGNLRISSISDSNPGIATAIETDCAGPTEGLDVTCDNPGTTQILVQGIGGPFLLGTFTLTIDVTCTMFVVPESPIGIIALMASSLGALGGFIFWKRRSKNPTDGMVGLGI